MKTNFAQNSRDEKWDYLLELINKYKNKGVKIMAKCDYCNKDMLECDGCDTNQLVLNDSKHMTEQQLEINMISMKEWKTKN